MSKDEYDDLDDLLIDEDPSTLDVDNGKEDGAPASAAKGGPSAHEPSAVGGSESTEAQKMMNDLQSEFANLLKEQEGAGADGSEVNKEAIDNFNNLINALGSVSEDTAGAAAAATATKSQDQPEDPDFKNVIADTLGRLKDSGTKIDSTLQEEKEAGASDDLLSQLLGQLVDGPGGAGGDGDGIDFNEDGMDNAILNILNQMSSKEVLYEPMLEMKTDFVQWFADHENDEEHKDKIDVYRKQRALVDELVALYEREDYDNALCREEITNILDELESLGDSPVSKGFNNNAVNDSGLDDLSKMLQVEGDDADFGGLDKDMAENCKQQ